MSMQEDIELAGLSEEEIEALQDETDDPVNEDDPDSLEPSTDETGDTSRDSSNNDPPTDTSGDDQVNAADAGSPDEPGKIDGGDHGQSADSKQDEAREAVTSEPAGFTLTTASKIEEVDAQLKEAKRQFDDGEMDFEEYLSQRDDLKAQINQALTYEDINRQVREAAWKATRDAFFEQNPEIAKYPSRSAGFAALFQGIDASEEGRKMSDLQALEAARNRFYEENPQLLPESQKEKNIDPKKNLNSLKAGQKNKQVRTLSQIPSAQANDTGDSEFVHLDNLPPEKLEKALEKMSESELERYLEAS